MNISVFGMGYVGCVSAACFSAQGNHVIGVDVNPDKVAAIQSGRSPIIEPGLMEMISENVRLGRLCATSDVKYAIENSDLSLICVGTPSQRNGSLDTSFVSRVSKEIGTFLQEKPSYHTVVVRSTILPGTTEELVLPILQETSEKQLGVDFGLAFNPEFLREGSAIADFFNPPRTVIGELDEISAERLFELYKSIEAPFVRTNVRVAEIVKYVDNTFHALKVSFTNEIGALCKAEGIDSHEVMDIFSMDTKLNLSPAYLKPGHAFGGSCLPKDVRALQYRMKTLDVSAPVIESIMPSNELQKKRGAELVMQHGKNRIGILGLSFKANTDDLRESPTVHLIETLIGKGYHVRIYDPNVFLGGLTGANRIYIGERLPHIAHLLANSIEEVLNDAEIVVVTTKESVFSIVPDLLNPDQIMVDLVRLIDSPNGQLKDRYYGCSW